MTVRRALAVMLVLLGVGALLFGGTEYPMCLGPVGVTVIDCVRATGRYPDRGIGTPLFCALVLVALAVAMPVRSGTRWWAVGAATLGAIMAGLLYEAFDSHTLSGLDMVGRWVTLSRPTDRSVLSSVVIGGGALGYLVVAVADRFGRKPAG